MRTATAALAFPALMQALSRTDGPATALGAAMTGPLAAYQAQGAFLGIVRAEILTVLASKHLPSTFVDRYRAIPVHGEHPAVAALRQLTVVTVPLGAVMHDYPALGIDAELWSALSASCSADATFVYVPIWLADRIGGVLGFIPGSGVHLGLDDAGTLLGLGAALGLWIEAHSSALALSTGSGGAGSGELPLVLTPRQREILTLVNQRKSNPVIAATVGFSVATVKAELARVMRMLRAKDRYGAARIADELGLLSDRSAALQ